MILDEEQQQALRTALQEHLNWLQRQHATAEDGKTYTAYGKAGERLLELLRKHWGDEE